jgi:uncharacterized protein YhfF
MTPESFWRTYLATLPPDHRAHTLPLPVAEGFGDSAQLAEELGKLIYEGVKAATCASLWEHEAEGIPIPEVGQYDIVLDGQNQPLAINELTEVSITPFEDVDAAFAFDEGEGDRSLESWRTGHWRFFSRVLTAIGRDAHPKMPLICQRFRVVFRR